MKYFSALLLILWYLLSDMYGINACRKKKEQAKKSVPIHYWNHLHGGFDIECNNKHCEKQSDKRKEKCIKVWLIII